MISLALLSACNFKLNQDLLRLEVSNKFLAQVFRESTPVFTKQDLTKGVEMASSFSRYNNLNQENGIL
jgi:hypothetical protein